MEREQHNEHAGKQYKPPKDHPWRRWPKSEVARWAFEKSKIEKVNDFKIGKLK
jgi:hypothetical protein